MYGEEQLCQAEGDLRLPPLHRDSLLLPLQLLRPYWEDKMGFLSSPAAAPQMMRQPMKQLRLEVDFEKNPHLMKSFPELFKEGSTLITREAPVEPASLTTSTNKRPATALLAILAMIRKPY
jgi:hypothetical protein